MYFLFYEKGINVLYSNSKIKELGFILKFFRIYIIRDID